MKWTEKYKVIRVVPGPIIAPWGAKIDLSNPDLPVETIKRLHEAGCPYIQPIIVAEKSVKKPDAEVPPPIPTYKPGGYKPKK